MAIDASGFKVGNSGQTLIGPDGTNYWGTFSMPNESDPNNTAAWGYQNLSVGATQFMPSTTGWSTDPSAKFYSASDFTNVPDSLKWYFSQPGTTIQGFKSAPVGVQVTQAPEESFLSSFMQGPMSVIGPALGISGFMNGGLPGLSELFSGQSPVSADYLSGLNTPGLSGMGYDAAAGGLADIPWGVNPQGDNMDWWDSFINAVGDNYGTGGVTGSTDATAPFNGFDSTDVNSYSDYGSSTGYGSPGTSYQTGPGGSISDVTGTLPPEVVNNPGFIDQLKSVIQQTGLNPTSALKLLGQLGAAGLGAFASNQQANALQGLANKYSDMGAPYRALLASSYADPAGYLANDPAIQASVNQGTNALARALSVKGNPAQSGTALTDIQNYATQNLYGQLGNERNRLANFGGLSGFNAAAPTLDAQAVGQQGNMYNALGYGLQQVTNPQPSLTDIVKAMNLQGLA